MENLKESLKSLMSEAEAWFTSLTSRERVLVGICGGTLLAFVLFVVFFSLGDAADKTRRSTERKLLKLAEVQQLALTFHESEQARQDAEKQLTANKVSLLSYLEEKGKKSGMDIPTMNPKGETPLGENGHIIESSVEVSLTDITLTNLVQFLSAVEQGPGVVKVKYLKVEPRPANQVLTAWATVSTYSLKEGQ